jgi:hypothetical protein
MLRLALHLGEERRQFEPQRFQILARLRRERLGDDPRARVVRPPARQGTTKRSGCTSRRGEKMMSAGDQRIQPARSGRRYASIGTKRLRSAT